MAAMDSLGLFTHGEFRRTAVTSPSLNLFTNGEFPRGGIAVITPPPGTGSGDPGSQGSSAATGVATGRYRRELEKWEKERLRLEDIRRKNEAAAIAAILLAMNIEEEEEDDDWF